MEELFQSIQIVLSKLVTSALCEIVIFKKLKKCINAKINVWYDSNE